MSSHNSASFGGRGPLFDLPYYVYILSCSDGSYYVGCTSDLNDRMNRHNHGWVNATCNRLPLALLMYHVFPDKYQAFNYEKYLKSGSGRAFIKRHLLPTI